MLSVPTYTSHMEQRLCTTEQLAERIHVKPSTILRWGREGRIPVVRVTERTVRYAMDDVLKALHGREANRFDSHPEN